MILKRILWILRWPFALVAVILLLPAGLLMSIITLEEEFLLSSWDEVAKPGLFRWPQ